MFWRKKTKREEAARVSHAAEAAPSEPVDRPTSAESEAKPSPAHEAAKDPQGPKHPKPKILLMDMPSACEKALRCAGYNVNVGSFGTPYRVSPSRELAYVSTESAKLPNYEEQEIIIVDTEGPEPVDKDIGEAPAEGVDAVWQSCKAGVIDPRPCVMQWVKPAFERILNYGGVFVVFVSDKRPVKYLYGHVNSYREFQQLNAFTHTNWSFLDHLESLNASPACGREVTFDSHGGDLIRLLERGAKGVHYECTLKPHYSQKDGWVSLAQHKYDRDVAGILSLKNPERLILVLPRMPAAHQILVELLEKCCALWRPALFPHIEGGRWVHRPEYEIPQVTDLERQSEEVKRQTEERVHEIEAEIKRVREENSDWYVLLRGTGDDLVRAVIGALHRVGFRQVVDVDKQAREQGKDSTLREDIRIHDRNTVVVIDVKGVNGCPDDDEARQAQKHAVMRMHEWNTTDVHPVAIVNHQRHLPPCDRDAQAYRREIIDYARDTRLGLMTTWDLFRIVRNKEALSWPDTVVLPIFYRSGRIEPVPDHYHEIGKIVKVWQAAIGVVPKDAIQMGSRLAIEVGDTFQEIVAESLQVDSQKVESASPQSNCGIACENASARFREGMRVFLVVDGAGGITGQPPITNADAM